MIVPMCLLAAILGVNLRGFDNNILTQIGLVVLVGLAAKNVILIVEFAKQAEDRGADRFAAAVDAARTRLRPIPRAPKRRGSCDCATAPAPKISSPCSKPNARWRRRMPIWRAAVSR